MTIRVTLTDDHEAVREMAHVILASDPSYHIVGEASDGYGAVEIVRLMQPDVAVIDIGMPPPNGFEATRAIKRLFPDIHVLILSTHEDPWYVTEGFDAGATGYVVKRTMGRDLITALAAVHRGEEYISPAIALPPPSDGQATGAFRDTRLSRSN